MRRSDYGREGDSLVHAWNERIFVADHATRGGIGQSGLDGLPHMELVSKVIPSRQTPGGHRWDGALRLAAVNLLLARFFFLVIPRPQWFGLTGRTGVIRTSAAIRDFA